MMPGMPRRGFFIVFEGGEGSGKSTQMRTLVQRLKEKRLPVQVTKEPGGTEIGEKIRDILLNPAHTKLAHRAELLLYEADRAQHIEESVRPGLQKGKIIISDRFADSSTVYQGICRGFGREWVEKLNAFATSGLTPDLVVLLDVPETIGRKRILSRLKEDVWLKGVSRKVKINRLDRLDREKKAFHRKVRRGFLQLAKLYPRRFAVIDASQSLETVALEIESTVLGRLKKAGMTGRSK